MRITNNLNTQTPNFKANCIVEGTKDLNRAVQCAISSGNVGKKDVLWAYYLGHSGPKIIVIDKNTSAGKELGALTESKKRKTILRKFLNSADTKSLRCAG